MNDQKQLKIFLCIPRSTSDVLQATAICSRIKQKYPGCHLSFGVESKYADALKGCPNIDAIFEYQKEMDNPDLLKQMEEFDLVFLPHIYLQYQPFSNWVHSGDGQNIIFHFAWHCGLVENTYSGDIGFINGVKLFKHDEFYTPISKDFEVPKDPYILVVTGTGNEAETKRYKYWDEVIHNVSKITDLRIVQGGFISDKKLNGVIDYRGKTRTIPELNKLIQGAKLVLTVDSYPMHAAYVLDVPVISLFGSTYPQCSGPNYIEGNNLTNNICYTLASTAVEHSRCYKNQCRFNRNCINEILPYDIYNQTKNFLLRNKLLNDQDYDTHTYEEITPSLSGYTTIYNGEKAKLPYIEAIESVIPYCDEVIVLDGESNDGTWQRLQETFKDESKVKLFQKKWDFDIPGIDGQQKAYARALCCKEYCLQFDADQIFEDGKKFKLKNLLRDFPDNQVLMHWPLLELWGTINTIKENKWYLSTDYHMSRFCLSKNADEITHGIPKYAKIIGTDGKVYSTPESDGCFYVNIISEEPIQQFGPYTAEIEHLRKEHPEEYGVKIQELYNDYPHFIHLSWCPIIRKIDHFTNFWDDCWSGLYNIPKEQRIKRWFNNVPVEQITLRMKIDEEEKLFNQGGCHLKENETSKVIQLNYTPPKLLNRWFKQLIKEYKQ